MKSLRRSVIGAVAVLGLSVGVAGNAMATPSPNGPGQPGAPGNPCPTVNPITPGSSTFARGSVFNFTGGIAGMHYAGNPGTPSLANANSVHAVSQYDIACFQQATNHPAP
jgi:hypothetical protein